MGRIVKPKYVDPIVIGGGEQLTFRPPLLFREVSARVFPLKANIARLAEFCDQYLNLNIPDEIVHFTPALPYVYFMALNYGGMSATTLDAQRMGWVAQHEAFFLVPLQRWRREHGKLVFQGWTGVTPFIFVDDPLSMMTGREVYGWPKTQAWIEADRPVWTTHPRAPTRLFTMSVDLFHQVYAGEREPPRTLVTIDRDVAASYAEYPLNYKCPWSITSALPNMYAASLSLMEEAADLLSNLRLRGFPDFRTSDSLVEMARESLALYGHMLAGLSPFPQPDWLDAPLSGTNARAMLVEDLPRYFTSTINLKQFRDAERPELACYSALVESAMGVDRLNQIGMLGDWDLLRGDRSGGYSITISRYRAQPIIETLGLEVPNLYETAREGDVVTLRPSFPFWMDVDLVYGAGDVICSRSPRLQDGEWIEETQATGAAGAVRHGRKKGTQHRHSARRDGYSTALGAATLPIFGPMHFPDLTVQVYPLLADRGKLQALVDACWNRLFDGHSAAKLRLELAGAYVYLTTATVGETYGKMWSETENIGWWAEREVVFAIPVRWYSNDKLMGLAMIEPLVFANKPRAVVTDREVNGRNAFMALIESPPDVWASPGGPAAPRRLTRVATESFVELGFGLESRMQTLIEIDEAAPLPEGDLEAWQGVADHWGRDIVDDLKRKSRLTREQASEIAAGQALALEILARGAPLNRLLLKQYRDAADFDRACYQAVVHTQRRINRVHAIREIERPPHVALHRLANYPIVETLGLKIKHTRPGRAVVDYLEPVRPFWMRVGVTEDLGRVVALVDPHLAPDTAGDPPRHWSAAPPPAHAPLRHPTATAPRYFDGAGAATIGARLPEALREGDRRHLADKVQLLSRRLFSKELHALRSGLGELPDEARKAAVAGLPGEFTGPDVGPPPGAFAAFLDAQPLDRLAELADALRAKLPGWRPPAARRARAAELERLAGLALSMERLSDDERDAALTRLGDSAMRERCESLMRIFAAPARDSDEGFRGATARSLYEIGVALRRALGGQAPPPPDADLAAPERGGRSGLIDLAKRIEQWIVQPPDWTQGVSQAVEQALNRLRTKRFVAEYDFDATRLGWLEATLDPGAWEAARALAHVAESGTFPEAQRRADSVQGAFNPTAALALFTDAFAAAVEDWCEPARWLRMTRGEARQAVLQLADLQLVFEAILDDRWEAEGPPRAGPRARIPASCVGPFGEPGQDWASLRGLARTPGPGGPEFVVATDLL